MKVYDKSGKEYEVRHTVDAREWIASGNYFAENPKSTPAQKKTTAKKSSDKEEK